MKIFLLCFLAIASLFLSQVEAQQCSVVSTCTNRVAFRLDDIQDFFLSGIQQQMIQLFLANQIPLSIGIIGSPTKFGLHAQLINFLRTIVRNGSYNIEIVNHGYLHEDFSIYDLQEQIRRLNESNVNIRNVLQIEKVSSFIPPFNKLNNATVPALMSINFNLMSAQVETDFERPYRFYNTNFYHVPIGAATNDNALVEVSFVGVPAAVTFASIQQQLNDWGFAAVMTHPQEFAMKTVVNDVIIYNDIINQTQWQELVNLIQLVKQAPWALHTLGSLPLDAPNNTRPVFLGESCNCISFRLDDIQDFYLSGVQRSLMDIFKNRGIPLTIGIIGSPDFFGRDATLLTQIRAAIRNPAWEVDIAANGFLFEDFSFLNYSNQVPKLLSARSNLMTLLSLPKMSTFIPPLGGFNSDLWQALTDTNFTHASATFDKETGPYWFRNRRLYRFPAGGYTFKLANGGFQSVVTDVEYMLNSNGYASVVLHPGEFAQKDGNGLLIDVLNSTMISELNKLLDYIQYNTSLRMVPINRQNLDAPNRTIPNYPSCNCVAFRLDTIQDFFLSGVSRGILDVFNENKTAVTVSILGGILGSDSNLVSYLRDAVNDPLWDIEIANNGFNFTQFTDFDLQGQILNLNLSSSRIQQILQMNSPPTTFCPPLNSFDNNTLEALRLLRYTHMSSSLSRDLLPSQLSSQSLYRYPAAAFTTDLNIIRPTGVSFGVTWQQVQVQMQSAGFSVIQMTPGEFASKDQFGVSEDLLNQTMVSQLRLLIQTIKNAGLRIVPIDRINLDAPPHIATTGSITSGSITTAPFRVIVDYTTGVTTTGEPETSESKKLIPLMLLFVVIALL